MVKHYRNSARIVVISFIIKSLPALSVLTLTGCMDVKDGDDMVYHWGKEAFLHEWINAENQKLLFDPSDPVLYLYEENQKTGQWTYILQEDEETLVSADKGKIAGFDKLVYDRIENENHHFKACLKGYTGNTVTDTFNAEEIK